MRRLVGLAILLVAVAVGVALVRRPQQSRRPSTPVSAASKSEVATVSVTPEPTTTPPPTARPATLTAAPPSPAVAADGAALRAEADRLIAEGKVTEGIDAFRKAVAAAPTAANHGDLGSLLYRLTAFDEAALHLRAAAELDPGNADRWIALANVYYRKTNPGEAWKAEKRAREAEPGLQLGRDAAGMRVRK